MKKNIWVLMAILLLAGCEAQIQVVPEPAITPEVSESVPASVGKEVAIGDGEHNFWVELKETEVGKEVNIYQKKGDIHPAQSFVDQEAMLGLEMAELTAEDVNFDGYMDFGYASWLAASSGGSAYYVWDKGQEKFIRDPYGLEDLAMPKFDPEKQTIETWNHSGDSYTIEFYRYLDGKLTCVRRLRNQDNYAADFTATLTVEDYDPETGILKEVYREEKAEIGGVTYAGTEEFHRWENPDYHGE